MLHPDCECSFLSELKYFHSTQLLVFILPQGFCVCPEALIDLKRRFSINKNSYFADGIFFARRDKAVYG